MRNFEQPGRSVAIATHGMAATSHPQATLMALDVLRSGGNAMDAAIAACAVQCVVEPGSTGIGGDCFALLAKRGGSEIVAFNGSGRAPMAATTDWYASRGVARIERQTSHSVTVPGAVDAWCRLTADHGTRELSELLAPAIKLAREGYAITPRVHYDWAEQVEVLKGDPTARRMLLVDDLAPAIGTRHRQPELAQTLAAIGRDGRKAFYEGPVAEDMVGLLRQRGGLHSLEDFAMAAGEYVTPIRTRFRGADVYECPPNDQGHIALLLMNILGGFELADGPASLSRIHRDIEAARLAYAVRNTVLGDPAQTAIAVNDFLSEPFAASLRDLIKPGQLAVVPAAYAAAAHNDTVYICVIDEDRNCASFINSVFDTFGSGLVAPRSGVVLHNRGSSFLLDPGHPNAIAPGKRPMHTIIPGMLMRDGRAEMPFGVMGGHYQALGQAVLLESVLGHGLDLQEAMQLPRYFPRPGTSIVEYESTLPPATAQGLRDLGYTLERPTRPIGGAQAIRIDWQEGVLIGASDPRKDGCALGY